jgi:hypothetical protein
LRRHHQAVPRHHARLTLEGEMIQILGHAARPSRAAATVFPAAGVYLADAVTGPLNVAAE